MKARESEKNIRTLIFGVISYVLLHAVINVGGEESLLYNFKNYFWIILLLDVTINLFFDEKISANISKISNIFGKNKDDSDDDDDVSPYRLIVPDAKSEDIKEKAETTENKKLKKRKKKEKREKPSGVTFSNPLTTSNDTFNNNFNDNNRFGSASNFEGNLSSDFGSNLNGNFDNRGNIENLLEEKLSKGEITNKSTPLNFLSNNFSDSESDSDSDGDFTTDSEFNKFERSLSL
jgi:hypothetical protein